MQTKTNLVCVLICALLPDIDLPQSPAGFCVKPLSRWILKKYGHRTITHYVAFTSPHDPRTPPPPYDKMYDPKDIPLPKNFLPKHPFDNGEMTIRDEQLLPTVRTPDMIKKELALYYG